MILPDKAYTSPSTPPPPDSPGAGDTLPVLGSNPRPLKGPPTMTAQKHLRVALTLPIDPPHPFIAHNAGNPQALANRVQWERAITDDADNIRATVFAEPK